MSKQLLDVSKVKKMKPLTLYRGLVKYLRHYPSINKQLILMETKENFRRNRDLTDEDQIKVEVKKARLGMANVLMYVEKNTELMENYTTKPANYEALNPKDEDFLYF